MDSAEFQHHFKKLKAKWPKDYTDDMAAEIFDIIKNVEAYRFAKWIQDRLWDPASPKRDGFRNLASAHSTQSAPTNHLPDCEYCGNLGCVATIKKEGDQTYDYSFACTFCPRGQNEGRHIPKWHDSYRSLGHTPLWEDAEVIPIRRDVK